MNMFKRSRKAKDQSEALDAFTNISAPANNFKSNKTYKRKNKHAIVEEKPVIDLGTALPGSDDFRTSLIMPGLSARFSMLREQDDPNSKLGKASDDSVLFPKRASRMNLFGHNPMALTDIAEVESIRSSFRPPFADRERSNSFGDGYDSDSGSMMARSRPGEGNNLFGGRQKLYRIPTGSTRTLVDTQGGNKHMYEGDVSLSLFQQHRQREREARRSDEDNRISQAIHDADDSDAVQSPTLGHEFSQKRGTQSSTASARSNLRTSTAATSVASDSPSLQPTATMARSTSGSNKSPTIATSFRKLRDDTSKPARQMSQSKSAANLREKYRPAGIYSPTGLRGATPPASAGVAQPLDFGFSEKLTASRARQTESPTQLTNTEPHNVLANSLNANDRGKATAMGLFNKPAKEFDEQQYLQRQLQMHEGRNSPLRNNSRSASRASADNLKTQHDITSRATPSPAPSDRTHTPQLPPIPAAASSPPRNIDRPSRASNASPGSKTPSSRPRSKSSTTATAKDNVKARVESLIRRQNEELAILESEKLGGDAGFQDSQAHPNKEMGSTFLDDDDSSIEEALQSTSRKSNTSSFRMPDGEIHPAFRSSFATSTYSSSSQYSKTRSMIDENKDDNDKLASPTLGVDPDQLVPGNELGLSGLIRTHLRHESEKSVLIPVLTGHVDGAGTLQVDPTRLNANHVNSGPPTPTTAMSNRAQQMLSQAKAIQASAANKSLVARADDASNYGDDDPQDEKHLSHQRGDSSATTKERREFDEELAERRRRIREGLKSVVERDRSESPAGVAKGREHTLQAFAQPGDGLYGESQSRTRKLQRLNSSDDSSQAGSDLQAFEEGRGRDMSAKSSVDYARSRSSPDSNRQFRNTAASQVRSPGPGPQRDYDGINGKRSITPTSAGYGRNRSNSSAVERRPQYANDPSPPVPTPASPTSIQSPVYSSFSQPTSPRDAKAGSVSATSPRGYGPSTTQVFDLNASISRPAQARTGSPFSDHYQVQSTQNKSNGRDSSSPSGRSSSQGGRKRSGTKTQISSPTFISSTSSVPLIPLPQELVNQSPPPLPEMNPRRKVNAGVEKQHPILNLNFSNALRSPLETVPASPLYPDHEMRKSVDEMSPKKHRNRLRKTSSEGGNMASTARKQAILAEMNREKPLPPGGMGFPNRSATAIGLTQDGGMF